VIFWTPNVVAAAAGASWLIPPAAGAGDSTPLAGLSIDSRTLARGAVFVALPGDRFDGHDYIRAVIAAGAGMLLVERAGAIPAGCTTPVALVPSTRRALGLIAAAYRQRLTGTRVIAIAGSNGKTTTTRLIHAALATRLRGTAPAKSFNNDIGVPLTIFSAKPGDDYLLCEVGSNAPGEIAALAHIVRPDLAVIVSIGREHLEGFGSLAGVAAEEASIADGLAPGGVLLATAHAPELTHALAARSLPQRGITLQTFGAAPTSAQPDLTLATITTDRDGTAFTLADGSSFRLPLLGEHNAHNALAAVAVARRLCVPDADIARGLLTARGPEMRLERLHIAGVDLLNDAYNANPESTLAALRAFAGWSSVLAAPSARRVIVLGDHLEQGDHARAVHEELGRAIAGARFGPSRTDPLDLLIAVGPLAVHTAEAARATSGVREVINIAALDAGGLQRVVECFAPGDAVLLKGSRGARLERIVAALRAREPEAVPQPTHHRERSGPDHALPAL
jgi:UDP-N-acetylmuramoyl-tripeptide--D-alanyl-D-alanine ligase